MYKHQLAQELKTVLTSTLIIYVCLLNLLLLPLEAIRSLTSPAQRYTALCRRARRCGCGQCRRQG